MLNSWVRLAAATIKVKVPDRLAQAEEFTLDLNKGAHEVTSIHVDGESFKLKGSISVSVTFAKQIHFLSHA